MWNISMHKKVLDEMNKWLSCVNIYDTRLEYRNNERHSLNSSIISVKVAIPLQHYLSRMTLRRNPFLVLSPFIVVEEIQTYLVNGIDRNNWKKYI